MHVYTIVYMYSEVLNTGYLLHTCKYSVYHILLFFIAILFFQMTSDLFVTCVACCMKYYRSIFFTYCIIFSCDIHRPHLLLIDYRKRTSKQTYFFFLKCIKNCASSYICYAGRWHCTHIDAF